MRWLLWKDYRQNRLIVYTALVLLLAPHLIALYATCRTKFLGFPAGFEWRDYFGISSVWSLLISQVAVAYIGGNAIAGERVDRSSEFLFSLPIARGKLLASKILLSLAITAAIWLTNVLILHVAVMSRWSPTGPDYVLHEVLTVTGIAGLTFFCVAWCISSLIASPAYAACGGLLTPLFVAGGIWFVDYLFELHIDDNTVGVWWRGICLTLALPCFALGTWHYLRRVEP